MKYLKCSETVFVNAAGALGWLLGLGLLLGLFSTLVLTFCSLMQLLTRPFFDCRKAILTTFLNWACKIMCTDVLWISRSPNFIELDARALYHERYIWSH